MLLVKLDDGGVNSLVVLNLEVSWGSLLNDGLINWWHGDLSEVDSWVSISNDEVSWLVFGSKWLKLNKINRWVSVNNNKVSWLVLST